MKRNLSLFCILFVTGISLAQTLPTTENYVQTRVYLNPTPISSDTVKQFHTVQYFDGLGRPKQMVNVKASPTGKDVVVPIEYDGFGRQVKDYLPIPQSGTQNGQIYASPLGNATSIYGQEKIYSEKILENSPLDRILQQKQVGNDWTNHPVQFGYDANNGTEVKKYVTTTTWSNNATASSISISTDNGGKYPANQLYKNTVTDEDGNVSIEFKNGQGQTLLVRKNDGSQNVDTYYVYNEYDQLAFVVPPLAAVAPTLDQATLNNLCYQYRYDGKNRLVEKKLPGKGWEYMVYDLADRLILTQDANLEGLGKWLITKYDKLGRVVYTGILPGCSRDCMQGQIATAVITENKNATGFARNGLQIYYTNDHFFNIETVLSVNYYDTYPTGSPAIPTTVLGQTVLPQDAQNSNISTKSLATASYVKNIEDDNWTKTYTWYDQRGRAVGTHSINHLGGYTKTESELDFAGVVKQSKTFHRRTNSDADVVVLENFTYDNQNRLLTHKHKVNGGNEEVLAQNEYNELSQLKMKKVGGSLTAPLQEIDYTYNIRGWMTSINNPDNLNGDIFGYEIRYNQIEGLAFPDASDTSLQVKPRYNGNIAEIDWKTAINENDALKTYGYVYDGMNRLSAGFYQKSTNPSVGEYFEKVTYDLNGNINTLKRTAHQMGPTAMMIDNLTYQYVNGNGNSNRLQKITDIQQQNLGYPYKVSPTDIGYDSNGNMTSFTDKGISSIQYNFLNLPKQVTQNSINTSYVYRADGVKVKKLFGTVETLYLDGFQYKFTQPWEDETYTMQNPEMKLRIIPTSEGYYDALRNRYFYNYTDHLGNVRVSYSDHNGDGVVTGDIIVNNCYNTPDGMVCNNYMIPGEMEGVTNYYPFGLMHQSNYYSYDGTPYHYKYQGQELQETGFYSFKWRNYMPDVGRFFTVDPLAEEYEDYTPYQFSSNQPVHAKEVEGLESSNDLNKRFKYDAPKRDGALSVTRSVAAWGSYTGMVSSQVRKNYINTVSKLETTNSQGRTAAKMEARSQTPALTRSIIESERPSSIEKTKTSGTANKTNSSYNSKAEVYGKAGKALFVVGAAASAYNIATSDDPGKQAVKESAAWTGAILGGETGATIGSVGGPPGAAVGGVVGSILGGVIGGTVIPNLCENCVSPDKDKPVMDGGLKGIQDQQEMKKLEFSR